MAAGEVTAEQVERLISRVDGLVSALDAIVLDRRTYVDTKDLAILAKDVVSAQDDIDATRATLSKLVWVVVGSLLTFLFGLVTVWVSVQGAGP
jgi:hypothetical protein